jgi:hypothetical protein
MFYNYFYISSFYISFFYISSIYIYFFYTSSFYVSFFYTSSFYISFFYIFLYFFFLYFDSLPFGFPGFKFGFRYFYIWFPLINCFLFFVTDFLFGFHRFVKNNNFYFLFGFPGFPFCPILTFFPRDFFAEISSNRNLSLFRFDRHCAADSYWSILVLYVRAEILKLNCSPFDLKSKKKILKWFIIFKF